MRYSDYLNSVAVKHRTVSYNAITPKPQKGHSSASLPRIKVTFSQALELLAPYCGSRIIGQLKAVVPLAAYLTLFQLLVPKLLFCLHEASASEAGRSAGRGPLPC